MGGGWGPHVSGGTRGGSRGAGRAARGAGAGVWLGGEVGWAWGETWRGFSGWERCLLCVDGVGVIKIGLVFFFFSLVIWVVLLSLSFFLKKRV